MSGTSFWYGDLEEWQKERDEAKAEAAQATKGEISTKTGSQNGFIGDAKKGAGLFKVREYHYDGQALDC